MNEFGFRVERAKRMNDDFTMYVVEPARWNVYLPHHCDSWEIADELPQDEAIRELEKFIKEAQRALTILKLGLEWGDG